MREPATDLPRVLRGARLPLAHHAASARLDVLLFSGATAVVALHAIVDAFVAPEPGDGAGATTCCGASCRSPCSPSQRRSYPRLSAGARAAVAADLGALALEGAALAIADARAVGARGEDWTGFLLAPRRPRAARARRRAALALAQGRAGCATSVAARS